MFAVLKNIGKVSSLNASEFYLRTRLDPGGVFQRNMFLKRVGAAASQLSSLKLNAELSENIKNNVDEQDFA